VPGNFINLLPPEITRPKVSAAGPRPAVPVPSSAVPKFTKPEILIPDNFWSNLKQFLTERPIKVRERKDAPFTQTSFGTGVGDNLKDFFSSGPAPKGPVKQQAGSSLGIEFWRLWDAHQGFFLASETGTPALRREADTSEGHLSKDENFGWSQGSRSACTWR